MYEVETTIRGIVPVLFNAFTEEKKRALDLGKTGGDLTLERKIAEAQAGVYKNGKGIYIPAVWIKAALLGGASLSDQKRGRRSLIPYLKGLVFIDPREIPTGTDKVDFLWERWGKIPPKTGAAAIIRTAGLKDWEVSFKFVVAADRIPSDQLRECLEEAGLMVGIGNGRPEMGRFQVIKWEVVKKSK